ncbi:hypothetical protein ST47_g2843 [Ascochyta rabiei]|uniref:Uncharacterized protein n=2 Tax=Didymella rabiei TaxID=5454 RepID=A0A163IX89_DIDRA|nr:hypothetical protein ST47_g2843 [Ascochyta rabiei]
MNRSLRADSQQPPVGEAILVRCPSHALNRLRTLNEAEVITLFTPVVPHLPSTSLVRDMDPFEPLGRALPRQVRHVPFRMDLGMTELHPYFLPASGVVVVVICATENVLGHNPDAFERQLQFARNITARVEKDVSMVTVPFVLVVICGATKSATFAHAVRDFPAVMTMDDYTPPTLERAACVLFG